MTAEERFKEIKDFIPKALLFYTVVEPRRPADKSAGGIILTTATTEADKAMNQAGRILHMGALAYKTKTPGLDYSLEVNQPKVGDWVFYSRNAGMPLAFVRDRNAPAEERSNRIELVILSDTDMLATLTDKQVANLVGWSG
jgi:co-chaperonin GroES (HSP10)